MCNYFKFGSVVQEEMLLKEKVYERLTQDGQRPIAIAHCQSGELQMHLKMLSASVIYCIILANNIDFLRFLWLFFIGVSIPLPGHLSQVI